MLIDNDRCFMPEAAYARKDIPASHFGRLSSVSDLVFSSDCKIIKEAGGMVHRVLLLHKQHDGLSNAFRRVAAEDVLLGEMNHQTGLLTEMDKRVSLLSTHVYACLTPLANSKEALIEEDDIHQPVNMTGEGIKDVVLQYQNEGGRKVSINNV